MKELLTYFRTVRASLRALLVAAILTYFTIELVLRGIPPLFEGASKVADFFSRISIAYVSAFIFYFVVVHIKSERDKHNIHEYAGHKVYSIITSGHLFIQPLMQIENKKARFHYMDKQELFQLLDSVGRFERSAPLRYEGGENADWVGWYEYLRKSIDKSIDEIMVNNHLLDSELIKLITRIKECPLLKQMHLLYQSEFGSTLSVIAVQMEFFLRSLERLEEYAEKNLKQYKHITGEFLGAR